MSVWVCACGWRWECGWVRKKWDPCVGSSAQTASWASAKPRAGRAQPGLQLRGRAAVVASSVAPCPWCEWPLPMPVLSAPPSPLRRCPQPLAGWRAGCAGHVGHPAAAPRQQDHGLHAGLPSGKASHPRFAGLEGCPCCLSLWLAGHWRAQASCCTPCRPRGPAATAPAAALLRPRPPPEPCLLAIPAPGSNQPQPCPASHSAPEQVFTSAGAREFNAGVPDCWSIINGTDPVAWIPKVRAAPGWLRRTRFFVLRVAHFSVKQPLLCSLLTRWGTDPTGPNSSPTSSRPLPALLAAVGLQAGGPAREPGCRRQPGAAAHLL